MISTLIVYIQEMIEKTTNRFQPIKTVQFGLLYKIIQGKRGRNRQV